jgi:hypothetical protein
MDKTLLGSTNCSKNGKQNKPECGRGDWVEGQLHLGWAQTVTEEITHKLRPELSKGAVFARTGRQMMQAKATTRAKVLGQGQVQE